MSHEFKESIKSDVKYCITCGCLSYKNIPGKRISSDNFNIMRIDPLILKYSPVSLKFNPSSMYHINYIAHRKFGVLKIFEISKRFELSKVITFKAIGLMDKIYINNGNKMPIEYIEKISLACVLLSFQFNNYYAIETKCQKNINNALINRRCRYRSRINDCYQYIKEEIKDVKYWQIICLKSLNYNLSDYTALDYIYLFFHLGISFSLENDYEFYNKYSSCLNILDIIVNNNNICKYNQYVVALSIININFNSEKYFSKSIFKYIYGVDFSKRKYKFCSNEILKMINEFYCLNCNNFLFNRKIINSGEKPGYIKMIEILLSYKNFINLEEKNLLVLNILNNLNRTNFC
jgi:hypothetical protein